MKLTLTVILFCILNLAFGQSEKEYPIDIELQNCLDSNVNYTTKGMTDCVVQATEKWDEISNLFLKIGETKNEKYVNKASEIFIQLSKDEKQTMEKLKEASA